MKDLTRKPTTWADWLKAIAAIAALTAFAVWASAWWALLLIPFAFDLYITRRIRWSWWKELENPVTRFIMSWVDAIVFALVAVYFINIYFFQNYTIPSSSLEKSLLVGDYLFVSKMTYGPRVPQTPLHLPLVQHTLPGGAKSYSELIKRPYKRVHPHPVAQGDIVVFNYPSGDTVVANPRLQAMDYYALCHAYGQQLVAQQTPGTLPAPENLTPAQRHKLAQIYHNAGRDYILREPEFEGIIARPVDRRENYVKRCVGLPGQTLQIKERIIYTDGVEQPEPTNVQYNYRLRLRQSLPEAVTRELRLSDDDLVTLHQTGLIPLTQAAVQRLQQLTDIVESIELDTLASTDDIYPLGGGTGWTRDNYGPVWIPQRGATLQLTPDNYAIYERPIRIYEGHADLHMLDDGTIMMGDSICSEYTFTMDYYWMMGDNRHNSADSRYWGFVPEDHVVGKPIMVWLSIDKDRSWFDGRLRLSRLFRWVDNMH